MKYLKNFNQLNEGTQSKHVVIAPHKGYFGPSEAAKEALVKVIDGVFGQRKYKKLWSHGQFFESGYTGVSFTLTTDPDETYLLMVKLGRVTLEDQIVGSFTLQRRGDSKPLARTEDQYNKRGYGDVGLKDDQFKEAIKMLENFVKSKA
jgi:hypothetical protein